MNASHSTYVAYYYRITVMGEELSLGLGVGNSLNIFREEHAQAIRQALIADIISDGSMSREEAESEIKVVRKT